MKNEDSQVGSEKRHPRERLQVFKAITSSQLIQEDGLDAESVTAPHFCFFDDQKLIELVYQCSNENQSIFMAADSTTLTVNT